MEDDVGVHIRPEAPNDVDAIDRVVGDAFLALQGSMPEVSLVRTLRARGELITELTLVALRSNRVVGHLAMSEVTLDGAQAGGVGLAPVAVAPAEQGRGVGSELIRASLTRAEVAGWRFVVLLGHERYYPRFGFEPARAHGLTGDYGEHDGWMVRPLGHHSVPAGHVRYSSAFQA
ncbi:MAG: GNAT family N-acetyltransferase [Microthrixaceae bacterium]